jgi:hypothetical protein
MEARLKAIGAFWYDFVIGDDWIIAVGVAIALMITGLVATLGQAGWWIVPIAIVLLLPLSLWRAIRSR